jgi:hypothetical protein
MSHHAQGDIENATFSCVHHRPPSPARSKSENPAQTFIALLAKHAADAFEHEKCRLFAEIVDGTGIADRPSSSGR